MTESEISAALSSYPPDEAAAVLCEAITKTIRKELRRSQAIAIVLFVSGLSMLVVTIYFRVMNFRLWQMSLTLLIASVLTHRNLFGQRRPLMRNALTGLRLITPNLREKASFEPLILVAAQLNPKKNPTDNQLQTALHEAIARLLGKLTGEEFTALSDWTRATLARNLSQLIPIDLTIAILLSFGSARDARLSALALKLRETHTSDRVREAAIEYLKDIGIS
jgi:hypothetical protein